MASVTSLIFDTKRQEKGIYIDKAEKSDTGLIIPMALYPPDLKLGWVKRNSSPNCSSSLSRIVCVLIPGVKLLTGNCLELEGK